MNYSALLELATDLGYELAMCGAETFRVEESINRILSTYGVTAEVFSIPNCLIVSIETPEGELMTRMRRIGYHGNDLDGIECFNAISRAICNRLWKKLADGWIAIRSCAKAIPYRWNFWAMRLVHLALPYSLEEAESMP